MRLDDRLRRPPTETFHCGERIERVADEGTDDGVLIGSTSVIIFYCNLPPSALSSYDDGDGASRAQCSSSNNNNNNTRVSLSFQCREPSCGALLGDEPPAVWESYEEEVEHYGTVDPNFFDEGYTMAGTTGFKVWTGTRLLIETLAWPQPTIDGPRLLEIQRCLANGANVLELGAGVGVVGTYLSCLGANILLTDLPTLVNHAISPNLLRNATSSLSCPHEEDQHGNDNHNTTPCPLWLQQPNRHGLKVGKGWASCTPLDWTVPVKEQLSEAQITAIDFIVASDVVFLVSMLDSLLDTVAALFDTPSLEGKTKSFILSFQRRDAQDGEMSASFTTVRTIHKAIRDRGWNLECLSWRPVTGQKETSDGTTVDDLSEVFVFEITKGQ
jgi:hypothetical protein